MNKKIKLNQTIGGWIGTAGTLLDGDPSCKYSWSPNLFHSYTLLGESLMTFDTLIKNNFYYYEKEEHNSFVKKYIEQFNQAVKTTEDINSVTKIYHGVIAEDTELITPGSHLCIASRPLVALPNKNLALFCTDLRYHNSNIPKYLLEITDFRDVEGCFEVSDNAQLFHEFKDIMALRNNEPLHFSEFHITREFVYLITEISEELTSPCGMPYKNVKVRVLLPESVTK